MRAALTLVLLAFAGSAIAQESNGSLDVQTINGVRVWRPKPAPPPVVVPPSPLPPTQTTIVVVNTPPAPQTDEVIGLPVGLPFFHHRPHGRPQPPRGLRFPHPVRRF